MISLGTFKTNAAITRERETRVEPGGLRQPRGLLITQAQFQHLPVNQIAKLLSPKNHAEMNNILSA